MKHGTKKRRENKRLERKAASAIMLTLLLTSMLALAFYIPSIKAGNPQEPVFAIEPAMIEIPEPGLTFQINIIVRDSPSVVLWALNLTWNPDVLDVTRLVEGDFLKRAGDTVFLHRVINHTAGVIGEMVCMLLSPGTSSGNGVLCTITCTAIGVGYSDIDICWGILLNELEYAFYPTLMDGTVRVGIPPPPPLIQSTLDINPSALNLRSKGEWVTAYIEFPEEYNVADINTTTILLNGTVPAEPKPKALGDQDEDGVPDLMVKLSRAEVVSLILNNVDMEQLLVERFVYVTLTVTGELYDGTPFQGSCTIGVIYMGYRGAFYRALSQMLREHKTCTEKLLI